MRCGKMMVKLLSKGDNMKIKRLYEDAIIPTRAHAEDAGWDLYSYTNETIAPHQTVKIGTGIAAAAPLNTFIGIFARSGLATKNGLRPANCVGVVDSTYRGEIIVALHNDSEIPQQVKYGDRIAQMVVIPYISVDLEEVNELDKTERGDGGFGSSGK